MRLRRRYASLIDTQLDLFTEDNSELLARIAEARKAYDDARRDDAEDRFGEYQAWIEDASDALVRLRDAYASTLDDDAADEYVVAFERARRRRFPELTVLQEEDDLDQL